MRSQQNETQTVSPHREVGTAVGQVIPATQRRVVLAQVHLQVAEEVDILARREWQECACAAHTCCSHVLRTGNLACTLHIARMNASRSCLPQQVH